MHKGIVAGAVVLTLVAGAVGGFYTVEYKVRTAISDQFATAPERFPGVSSATYRTLDIDLRNGLVNFSGIEVRADLAALQAQGGAFEQTPKLPAIKGEAQFSVENVMISGLWNVIYGTPVLERVEFSNAVVDTRQAQSIALTASPTAAQLTMTTKINSTLSTGRILGLALLDSPADQAVPAVRLNSIDAQDYKLALTTTSEFFDDRGKPLQSVSQNSTITMAQVTGANLSPTYLGRLRYEGINIDLDAGPTPLNVTLGALTLTNSEFIDALMVRNTTEIKNLRFEADQISSANAQNFLAIMGVDQVNLDVKINYNFDLTAQKFTLSPLSLGLKEVGDVEVNFELTNLPTLASLTALRTSDGLGDAPAGAPVTAAQSTLISLFQDTAVNQISMAYRDRGAVPKIIAVQAQQASLEPRQLAERYAQRGALIVKTLFGEERSAQSQTTFNDFFADPDALRVQLNASPPVNVIELLKNIQVNGPRAWGSFELDLQGGLAD